VYQTGMGTVEIDRGMGLRLLEWCAIMGRCFVRQGWESDFCMSDCVGARIVERHGCVGR
jgi:hypothetical protein